ncbi:procathepsin L-like isoform X1 [Toxotes jaculatrix]|uniref:procathepsin L-like isoform X1 n=1 Tax=Toxotes jaculatrix TaxID=941984 RepID=UPI001B3A9D44|nr:procathepsin L-like isoform X1 [Toxotes jaculatrix]
MLLRVCVMLLVASDLGFCLDEALLDTQWKEWKITYGKEYNKRHATRAARSYRSSLQQPTEDEEEYRKGIWKKNMHIIEVHNQEAEQGKHSYRLGMNYLGDLTLKEMSEKMTCFQVPTNHAKFSYFKDRTNCSMTNGYKQVMMLDFPQTTDLTLTTKDHRNQVYNATCSLKAPKSLDYRKKRWVTRVKDQGSCGSCWAFSAVGALEGQLAKTKGMLLDLSPQNLVDCDQESSGCGGGRMTSAFKYVQTNGGINSEEDYPTVAKEQPCRYNKNSAIPVQCKGFKEIPEGDECALAEALHDVGPLSVAMDTSSKTFMLYKSGVYYNPECDHDSINHGMLLVGYGETAHEEKYWIVKNSFGTKWGEKGYIRVARNRGNHCGIASDASYPVMGKDE